MMNLKQSHVMLYDTTLRDGNQGLGIHLSLSDKLRITQKLDELGIHYIEGGWPNPTDEIDTAYYREVKKLKLSARVAAFGSTRRPGVRPGDDEFVKAMVASGAARNHDVRQDLGSACREGVAHHARRESRHDRRDDRVLQAVRRRG